MAGRYFVNLYDSLHNLQATITDFVELAYSKEVDTVSECKLTLRTADPIADLFMFDSIIEVQRRDLENGLDWYTDFQGLVRGHEHKVDDKDRLIHIFIAKSPMDFLRRRHVMFPAGSSHADIDVPGLQADDAMKHYVADNLSAAATAPPRDVNGSQMGQYISVQANASAAPLWVGQESYRNLYDVVREIGLAESVDFDMVWIGSDGAPLWEFRTYYPQSGTDRTTMDEGPLVFAPTLGNVILPDLTIDRSSESNAILVVGQGTQDARSSYFQSTTAVNDTIYNYCETSQSQRQEDQQAGLASTANYYLNHLQTQYSFDCTMPISSPTVYGRDYFLGDKVFGTIFPQSEVSLRILKEEVTVSNSKEQIKITFGTLVQ